MNTNRFLFDTDFSTPDAKPQPRVRRAVPLEEVEKAKADAYLAGTQSMEVKAAQAQAMAIGRIAEAIMQVLTSLDAAIEHHRKESAALAHAIARKLAEAALAALPASTIEAVIGQALAMVPQEPRIVVRADPAAVVLLKDAVARIALEHGFAGRVVIIGEAGFAAGNCRIEWADGGLERSFEAIDGAIRAALAHDAAQETGSSEGSVT